jgi:predicted RNA-binding protein
MKDILEYQFGIKIDEELEIKKEGRKIYLYKNKRLLAVLNPRFGLFTIFKDFFEYLIKNGKFIKVKSSDIDFIKKSKNIFKINVVEIGNFEAYEDVAIIDEKNNLVGIGRTKISSKEFLNSKSGLVAKIRG